MTTETDPIFASPEGVEHDPIYREWHKSSNVKVIIGIFLGIVILSIALCIILVSVQSYKESPIYVLLLINMLAFAQTELFVVFFIYSGHLAKSCVWAIFLVGVCVIIESISTDILVFTI